MNEKEAILRTAKNLKETYENEIARKKTEKDKQEKLIDDVAIIEKISATFASEPTTLEESMRQLLDKGIEAKLILKYATDDFKKAYKQAQHDIAREAVWKEVKGFLKPSKILATAAIVAAICISSEIAAKQMFYPEFKPIQMNQTVSTKLHTPLLEKTVSLPMQKANLYSQLQQKTSEIEKAIKEAEVKVKQQITKEIGERTAQIENKQTLGNLNKIASMTNNAINQLNLSKKNYTNLDNLVNQLGENPDSPPRWVIQSVLSDINYAGKMQKITTTIRLLEKANHMLDLETQQIQNQPKNKVVLSEINDLKTLEQQPTTTQPAWLEKKEPALMQSLNQYKIQIEELRQEEVENRQYREQMAKLENSITHKQTVKIDGNKITITKPIDSALNKIIFTNNGNPEIGAGDVISVEINSKEAFEYVNPKDWAAQELAEQILQQN